MVLKLKYGTTLLNKYGTSRTQAASWTLEKLPLPSTGNGALAIAARCVTLRPKVGSNRAALHARGHPSASQSSCQSPVIRSPERDEARRPRPLCKADMDREKMRRA